MCATNLTGAGEGFLRWSYEQQQQQQHSHKLTMRLGGSSSSISSSVVSGAGVCYRIYSNNSALLRVVGMETQARVYQSLGPGDGETAGEGAKAGGNSNIGIIGGNFNNSAAKTPIPPPVSLNPIQAHRPQILSAPAIAPLTLQEYML